MTQIPVEQHSWMIERWEICWGKKIKRSYVSSCRSSLMTIEQRISLCVCFPCWLIMETTPDFATDVKSDMLFWCGKWIPASSLRTCLVFLLIFLKREQIEIHSQDEKRRDAFRPLGDVHRMTIASVNVHDQCMFIYQLHLRLLWTSLVHLQESPLWRIIQPMITRS